MSELKFLETALESFNKAYWKIAKVECLRNNYYSKIYIVGDIGCIISVRNGKCRFHRVLI